MKGDGKGNFITATVEESGFFVNGDAKGLAKIHTAKNEDIWIATQNHDSIIVHSGNKQSAGIKWIDIKPDDFFADIIYRDGKKRRVEFYYGSTFLSQSSRKLPVEKQIRKITITNFRGNKRDAL